MTFLEWLLWTALVSAVLLAYSAIDTPALCARAAHHLTTRPHGDAR